MLLANNPETNFTVAMATIAALGSFGSAVLNYLGTRDKLKYDKEMAQMRSEVEHLREKTEDCHKERDELKDRVQRLEDKA